MLFLKLEGNIQWSLKLSVGYLSVYLLLQGLDLMQLWELSKQSLQCCCLCIWCWHLCRQDRQLKREEKWKMGDHKQEGTHRHKLEPVRMEWNLCKVTLSSTLMTCVSYRRSWCPFITELFGHLAQKSKQLKDDPVEGGAITGLAVVPWITENLQLPQSTAFIVSYKFW